MHISKMTVKRAEEESSPAQDFVDALQAILGIDSAFGYDFKKTATTT